jgi:ubiquinol-cytochrome c reductase cytochrome b subunit
VVVPSAFFTILAAWPFVERRISHDARLHNLLDRPRDNPMRSGVGAAGITFMAVLTLAGSNDLLAYLFRVSVEGMNAVLRVLLVAGPVAAGLLTYLVCRELHDREFHPLRRPDRVALRRTAEGGFETVPVRPASRDAFAHEADAGDDQQDRADEQEREPEHHAAAEDRHADAEDERPR